VYELEKDEVSPRDVYIIGTIIAILFLSNFSLKFINITNFSQYEQFIRTSMMIGSLIVIIFTFAKFRLSLLVFIFVAPLIKYSLPNMNFFFTYSDAYLVILAFVWISKMAIRQERSVRGTILDKLIFVFIVLTVFSMMNSRDLGAATKELTQTLEFFVFCYYIFAGTINRRSMLNAVIHAMILCGALISLYGIYQYSSELGSKMRIMGTFGHFNAMGSFTAMMLVFAFNMALGEKNRMTRAFFLGALTLDVTALALTFSRGAWIGAILGIVVSAWIRGMTQFLKAFSVVVAVLIMVSVLAPRVNERLSSVPKIEDTASKNRLRQWQIAYETITSYPLLGIGLASNEEYVTEKYNEPANGEIHNLFLHIGSERGLPAMIVLALIFLTFFVNINRRISNTDDNFYRSLYVALFSVMISYGVVNLFAYQLIRGLGLFFAMFMGIYMAAIYIEENEPEEAEWADMISTLNVRRPRLELGM
jgi:O-antigen ligase